MTPIDGWGYQEAVDGKLAPCFEIDARETGVEIGDGIRGWRGTVTTGKYAGAAIDMTPRHTEWTGWVVASVRRGEEVLFSGMAETVGLECDWL